MNGLPCNARRHVALALAIPHELLGELSARQAGGWVGARLGLLESHLSDMPGIRERLISPNGPCPQAISCLADLVSSQYAQEDLVAWQDRLRQGLDFLGRIGCGESRVEQSVYFRVVHGHVVKRRIAFDWSHTLVDLSKPYTGVQGLLIGLWVTHCPLFIYSDNSSRSARFAEVFEQYSAFQLAFQVFAPDLIPHGVDREHIEHCSAVMHSDKRRGLVIERFSADPDAFSSISDWIFTAKLPLPEAAFEVLVDDSRVQGERLESAGFGRCCVVVDPPSDVDSLVSHGCTIFTALNDYFSRPLPTMTSAAQRWVQQSTS